MGERDMLCTDEAPDIVVAAGIDDMAVRLDIEVLQWESMAIEVEVSDLLIEPGRPIVDSLEALDCVTFDLIEVFVFCRLIDELISCRGSLGDSSGTMSVSGLVIFGEVGPGWSFDLRRKTTSLKVRLLLNLVDVVGDCGTSFGGADVDCNSSWIVVF